MTSGASTPTLFPHLTRKIDRVRVFFGLAVFGSFFLLVAGLAWYDESVQDDAFTGVTSALDTVIEDLRTTGRDASPESIHKTAEGIFMLLFSRLPDSDNRHDQDIMNNLTTLYVGPIIRDRIQSLGIAASNTDDTTKQADLQKSDKVVMLFRDYISGTIAYNYPLHTYRSGVIGWTIFGVVYFLLILILYCIGLTPDKGERAFNVLDVSFFAVLVVLSGGFGKYLWIYVPSLLLSAKDYAHLVLTSEDNRVGFMAKAKWHLRQTVLDQGAYFLALFANVFWVLSGSVILGRESLSDLFLNLGLCIATGGIAWMLLVILMVVLGRTLQESNSSQAGLRESEVYT